MGPSVMKRTRIATSAMVSLQPHKRSRTKVSRHRLAAAPAGFEAALHQLAAAALPAPLRQALQLLQELARSALLLLVGDPDLRQALVGRQLAGGARKELALDAGLDAGLAER